MEKITKNIRHWILFFMCMLFISGLTAIPAETELEFLCRFFPRGTALGDWLDTTYIGLHQTNQQYPFLAYGYDWLAFAHFILAILFIGPLKNPVRNKWVIEFGIIACLLIIPFALVAGYFRSIPLWWRLIDCSFGIIGIIPLTICLRQISKLETINSTIE
jgi:hypothetical protein